MLIGEATCLTKLPKADPEYSVTRWRIYFVGISKPTTLFPVLNSNLLVTFPHHFSRCIISPKDPTPESFLFLFSIFYRTLSSLSSTNNCLLKTDCDSQGIISSVSKGERLRNYPLSFPLYPPSPIKLQGHLLAYSQSEDPLKTSSAIIPKVHIAAS